MKLRIFLSFETQSHSCLQLCCINSSDHSWDQQARSLCLRFTPLEHQRDWGRRPFHCQLATTASIVDKSILMGVWEARQELQDTVGAKNLGANSLKKLEGLYFTHQLFLRQRRQLSNVWLAQGCRSKRFESSSPRTVYCTETSVWDRLRAGEKATGLGIHFCCSIAPCSPVNR